MNRLLRVTTVSLTFACLAPAAFGREPSMNSDFEQLSRRYVDESPGFSPIRATTLGDHRFDGRLDDISAAARAKQLRWIGDLTERLERIDATELSRENQVDYALLRHALDSQRWRLTQWKEWSWNPLIYTGLAGDAVYGLMARDFAPARERLNHVAARLERLPAFLEQVRGTLDAARVPAVHAQTAVAQNLGVLKAIDQLVLPLVDSLPPAERDRMTDAIATARQALGRHQQWLEDELLPRAKGDFRIGLELYEQKLAFALHSPLRRQEIRALADRRVRDLHDQMYGIAKEIYREQYPRTRFPTDPSAAFQRVVIRFALEKASAEAPAADEIVAAARRSVAAATEFIRRRDLVTIMPDPLEIIVMPEFQRGVSLAYCDAPGPLETGQKTFYAVSPIPANWTARQVNAHLREYNTRSVDVLTIHEAMPGHFLQMAHANRHPGRLRHLLRSGTFVEGWAVYTEWMMCEEGFRDDDPLLKLVTLKWYLRDVANAILDQGVHVEGMSRDEAMRLMVEDAFQEEPEAAGKWTRARLTSGQLSTYFVGYLEHVAMRRKAEQAGGADFDLKAYHDRVLSFGAPPTQFVQALLLQERIPLPEAAAP